jgi:hypothetical protein
VEQYLQRCAGNETGLHSSVVVKVLLQRFSKREGVCVSVYVPVVVSLPQVFDPQFRCSGVVLTLAEPTVSCVC